MAWMMARKGIPMMGIQPRGSRVRGSRRCGRLRRSAPASSGHTRTKTNARLVAVVAVSGLILAGCGGTTNSVPSPASPAQGGAACGTVGATGPGGGKIFYVDMSRPAGSQCFEAAPDGWNGGVDPGAVWGCEGTAIPGTAGVGIGTGGGNTAAIVAGCVTAGIAAKLADTYAGGGQTDWFLPSRDELNQLCKYARGQLTTVANQSVQCNGSGVLQAGFAADTYWSSSHHIPVSAWDQFFGNGFQGMNYKTSPLRVRPVSAF